MSASMGWLGVPSQKRQKRLGRREQVGITTTLEQEQEQRHHIAHSRTIAFIPSIASSTVLTSTHHAGTLLFQQQNPETAQPDDGTGDDAGDVSPASSPLGQQPISECTPTGSAAPSARQFRRCRVRRSARFATSPKEGANRTLTHDDDDDVVETTVETP